MQDKYTTMCLLYMEDRCNRFRKKEPCLLDAGSEFATGVPSPTEADVMCRNGVAVLLALVIVPEI